MTDRVDEVVSFEARLFGSPRVVRRSAEGEAEVRWPLERALVIFAALALADGGEVGRDRLAFIGWPDARAEAVEANFHPTISILRRVLLAVGRSGRSPILFAGGSYRLDTDLAWSVDVIAFRAAIRRGRGAIEAGDAESARREWSAAREIGREPFLGECGVPWAVEQRRSLAAERIRLLRDLARHHRRLGRLEEGAEVLEELVRAEPLDEVACGDLLESWAALGRRDRAVEVYRTLVAQLALELGVDPLPETAERFHRALGWSG